MLFNFFIGKFKCKYKLGFWEFCDEIIDIMFKILILIFGDRRNC